MMMKWIGAALVVVGCGGTGFSMVAAHKREEKEIRQLMSALDYMQCELQYRMTPLPDLCRQTAVQSAGGIRSLFLHLATELEDQVSPDVSRCMNAAVSKTSVLTDSTAALATNLGKTLGRFDLEGQLRGLEQSRSECRRVLDKLTQNQETRLRSYQTLGLCAGAALAILFL